MKLFPLTFLFAVLATAAREQKTSILVTYDPSVPEYIIEQAKDAIRAAVGYLANPPIRILG